MSRAARTVVRIAARTLPAGVRERYREEWLGDIAGSRAAGVAASGIAAAAVLFSATMSRDTPDILGMPLSVAARRHARWATALLLSAMVFAFGGYITGSLSIESSGALQGATALWIALTVVGTIAGLIALWRAALLSSPLAKIGAVTLTASILVFASGLVIPPANMLGVVVLPVGLVLAMIGTCIAAAAWAGSAGPGSPAAAAIPTTSRRLPPALILSLVVAGVLLASLTLLLSSLTIWLAVFVIPVAALVGGAIFVLRTRRTAHEAAPRAAWYAVIGTATLALATVALGALDLLVWSPQAMAPDYALGEIWAALPPAELAAGMAFVIIWIVFWTVATLVYLAGGISVLGRAARPSTRSLTSAGLLLVAGAVFFQFFAGFGIGMSISDTLPPFRGGGSDIRAWCAMLGQLSLVASLVLSIAPRSLPALEAQRT
ncbi:hypothetical protein IWX81_001379 [Salinibacterium sp. CAN_S4]|uniref:hypothetical protein n=1 Tax=Salinibacterium sp. CAN_S4 TaxID=2787727 RepID=UPI0018EFEB6D